MSEEGFGVLFVCLGNICRSPIAHGVFEHKIASAGLADRIHVDSCGTSAYHVGEQPDPGSIRICRERGLDITSQRSRRLKKPDFERFDLLLAMDQSNLRDMRRICPRGLEERLGLFRDFGEGPSGQQVPDPWGGGADGFTVVYGIVDDVTDHLLEHVKGRLS